VGIAPKPRRSRRPPNPYRNRRHGIGPSLHPLLHPELEGIFTWSDIDGFDGGLGYPSPPSKGRIPPPFPDGSQFLQLGQSSYRSG